MNNLFHIFSPTFFCSWDRQTPLWRGEWLGKSDCVRSALSLTKIPAPIILNLTINVQYYLYLLSALKKPTGCDWILLLQGIYKYITGILCLFSRLSTLIQSILGCHKILYLLVYWNISSKSLFSLAQSLCWILISAQLLPDVYCSISGAFTHSPSLQLKQDTAINARTPCSDFCFTPHFLDFKFKSF